jgi:hypothetical protein
VIWLLAVAGLVAGFALGRARLGHRASQWAAWQSVGTRPTGWRYVATFTVLSAENLGWLIAHPAQGRHAWQHRNDPPPPRSPAPRYDPDWADKRHASNEEN